MPRGGKRSGSGRKVGSANPATKRSRAVADKALADGITPLEVMLDNMRHFRQVALDAEAILAGLTAEEFTGRSDLKPEEQFKLLLAEVKKAAGFRQMAQDCATDAAPYSHHRLTAIEHSGNVNLTHEAQLDELE
jgi:hypothetical protein